MSKRRAPSITAEERERHRLEARELSRARCAAAAAAKTVEAREWLAAQGVIVPGEGVGAGLRRLDGYRRTLLQTSAPSYRPSVRQLLAEPVSGIVEIEF